MDLKKVEKNLTAFSSKVLDRMESDIKNMEEKSARTEFDKVMKKRV